MAKKRKKNKSHCSKEDCWEKVFRRGATLCRLHHIEEKSRLLHQQLEDELDDGS